MPIDAIYTRGLVSELKCELCGARVDKIHQPDRDAIVIAFRKNGFAGKLLLSANPSNPRVHLIKSAPENPAAAPMFCMLLRKHLGGARIESVDAPELERIIEIRFETTDELGVLTKRTLTVEMLGRHSNIIFTDESGMIIQCLRRVDIEMSEKRQVLPGLLYRLPPPQNKLNPMEISRAQMFELVRDTEIGSPDKWLLDKCFGLSPLICREIAYRAGVEFSSLESKERLCDTLVELMNTVKQGNFTPCMLLKDGVPKEFSFTDINQYGTLYEKKLYQSLGELADDFFRERDSADRMRRKSASLMKLVTNARERIARKLALQREEMENARSRELLRKKADIITANLYRLEKGMNSFSAEDYFLPELPMIEIELDIRLTPQENAARLYKNYRRLKNAEEILTFQIKHGEEELAYIDSVLESIVLSECESDIAEVREELIESGYIAKPREAKKLKRRPLAPHEFVSTDGFRIYAGKNNRQNDMLTLKSALKGDMWLHTQKIHGSHVIIECDGREPTPLAITQAAVIAAYYSKSRESKNVPVDYTWVRFVKKPGGARPGMVIYTNQQTAYVTPDAELVRSLRV